MDCSAMGDHLSSLADGELEGGNAESVWAHLRKCPRCNRLFHNHVNLKQLLRKMLPVEKAPPGLRSAVLDRLNSLRMREFFHAP
jgi:anti-sigma factor (TIGR02949 family)